MLRHGLVPTEDSLLALVLAAALEVQGHAVVFDGKVAVKSTMARGMA